MKTMKKVFALVLALAMTLSLAISASAATTYTLTINNTNPGHIYEAYQIFKGDLSSDESTLSNVSWGDSITDGDGLLAALKADTKVVDGGVTLGAIFSAANSVEKVAEILGTVSNDSATLDRFAEIVGDYLAATPVATSGAHTGTQYVISDLPVGYYLVKDKDGTQDKDGGWYTKYIVRLVKSAEVNVKGSGVIVDKTINDTLDGTYHDQDDFDVNDTAYFKWDGTLPTNLRAYDTYKYKFEDTLPTGLTFLRLEAVYVESHSGTPSHVFLDMNDADAANDTLPAGVALTTTADTVTLDFADLLTAYPSLLSTDHIVVKYSCRVNRDMLIKEANTNEVKLTYSNNPNGDGVGYVEDDAHAFTFSFTVDKYDMADESKKLEGVEFLLYYRTVDSSENIVINYAQVVTEELVAANFVLNGTAVDNDDLGLVYGWTTDKAQASVLDTDANGAFSVKGLDAGTYFLEETKTVDGYNLLTTPVQIDIIPTYADDGTSVTVEHKVDSMSQGTSDIVHVRNSKGSTLPSTGGIGTTIFYVSGGILVAAAVVLLVTKKRMAK